MALLPWTFEPSAVPAPCDFANLPSYPALEELRARRQWVAWKYEWRNGPDRKPTKPPISPHSGFGASHSKPSSWGSYRQACDYAERKDMAGVGFVLSHDDNLTGADLDGCRDPVTGKINAHAAEIVALAETYTEVSPSGTGLRLIWRGKVDAALKCDALGIEVYGKQRYLTITGWHLDGTPEEILPAPRTWAALQARVAEWKAAHEAERVGDQPEAGYPVSHRNQRVGPATSTPLPPSEGGSEFFRAVNTASLASLALWVPDLFGRDAVLQPGTGAYRVGSKALGRRLEEDLSIAPNGIVDWGVHDMGDGRQGKRTPVDLVLEYGGAPDARTAAFWLCERLGHEPTQFGWADATERGAELAAGLLARRVVEAPDGTLADAETGEVVETPDPEGDELPAAFAHPPGLVGELTDWICGTARRPQRALALGAALTLVGTAAGRHIMGPTRSGTHLYVVGLAPTGAGKDHALQQIMSALSSVEATHLIGPSQFISMPAVINHMTRKPLSLCAMDEFGAFLKRINSRRASGFEGAISGVLRTAWSTSFKVMTTPEWAQRQAEAILAPALSIYGVSTADEFYGALEGGDASNGFLNRMLVVETRKRPKDRAPALSDDALPVAIAARLRGVLTSGGVEVFAQLQRNDAAPPRTEAVWGAGAEAAYAALIEQIHKLCDGRPMAEAFYARAAETSLRVATILAIGIDPVQPVVTLPLMTWARDFVMWAARSLERGGTEHIADSENQSTANLVRRAIREAGGRMKHRDLLRRLNHKVKNRDLHDVIKALVEAEHVRVEKVTPEKGGPPTLWYTLA